MLSKHGDARGDNDTAPQIEKHPVLSTEAAPPADAVDLPPLTVKQWLQVLSAFVVFFNTWGLALAFGAFQTFYQQTLLPDNSSSNISWISTVCVFILLFSGLVTGPLFDYGYLRPLLAVGSLLEVFGLMMISLSTEYYQIFLAQGICVGLGGGMLYIPSIASAAANLHERRRAKFMGFIASGTGIGGIIYPVMFRQLLSSVGFPWTVRIIAFVVFGTYFFAYPVLWYTPSPSPRARRWVDTSAFSDSPFLLTTTAAFFGGFAYYLPLLYLPLFAETGVPGFNDPGLAFYLLSIVNGASVIGRLAAGAIATKLGPLETSTSAVLGSSLLLFCWIAVHSTAGIIVWSVFWGLASSVIVAMPGAMIPLLSPSLDVIGTRTGMYWAAVAIGLLIGSPVGGALVNLQLSSINWWHLQLIAALFMMVSGLLTIPPTLHARKKKRSLTHAA